MLKPNFPKKGMGEGEEKNEGRNGKKEKEKGDGPFQVLKHINYNAYKIALPLDYGVSNTFNVTDMTLCDVGTFDINSRVNSSQEGGYNRGLSKEEEFGKRLSSLMEEREKEVKFIYFSKLLE